MSAKNERASAVALAFVGVLGIGAIVGSGSNPPRAPEPLRSAKVSNEFFEASISTTNCESFGCKAIDLSIQNKTSKNIEIDWNKTLYISSGTTSGGFMYEGIQYIARNNPKSPDVVFANSTFRKTIYPNNLVMYVSGVGWMNNVIEHGETGVYLTTRVGTEEVNEKLILSP